MNRLNVQKCDPDASKKKALIQSFKKKGLLLMLHTNLISESTRIQILPFAALRRTQLCKTVWGNPHSSERSVCGSLIGPGSAAGPSDALQTVSQPAGINYTITQFPRFNTLTTACTRSIQCERSKRTLPCVCSDEAASFHYPAGFSPLQAPRF